MKVLFSVPVILNINKYYRKQYFLRVSSLEKLFINLINRRGTNPCQRKYFIRYKKEHSLNDTLIENLTIISRN